MSAVWQEVRRLVRSGRSSPWLRRQGWLIVLVGVSLAALGWRVIADSVAERRYAIAAVAAIGTIVLIVSRLCTALCAAERNAAELMSAYVHAQREFEQRDRSYRERLHDARSAAASVSGAVHLLTRQPSERRDDGRRLQRLLTAELARMQDLLDTNACEPLAGFDLAAALEPIVLTHRLAGTRIDNTLEPVTVVGRPHATASVLDNLLRNARVHAPGARVSVRVVAGQESATVVVDDDGPGIPGEECERLLLPGERGTATTAPGSGLGLHIAATTIAAMSGTLTITPRPGGGTRVRFCLPIAAERPDRLAPVHRLAS